MGRPLMGYNLEPKNSFTGLLHPDVLGWIMGGKGEERAEMNFCPKKLTPGDHKGLVYFILNN